MHKFNIPKYMKIVVILIVVILAVTIGVWAYWRNSTVVLPDRDFQSSPKTIELRNSLSGFLPFKWSHQWQGWYYGSEKKEGTPDSWQYNAEHSVWYDTSRKVGSKP